MICVHMWRVRYVSCHSCNGSGGQRSKPFIPFSLAETLCGRYPGRAPRWSFTEIAWTAQLGLHRSHLSSFQWAVDARLGKSGVNEPYRKATRAPSCRQVRVRCLRELLRKGSVQMFHREVDDLVGGLPDRPRAEPQSLNAHVKGLSCTSRARFVSALEEAFHPRQKRPGRLPFPAFPSSQSAGVHANPSSFLRKAQARALARTNCSASGGCRRPAAGCSPKGWPPPCRH
jgi:hypothetical protein